MWTRVKRGRRGGILVRSSTSHISSIAQRTVSADLAVKSAMKDPLPMERVRTMRRMANAAATTPPEKRTQSPRRRLSDMFNGRKMSAGYTERMISVVAEMARS